MRITGRCQSLLLAGAFFAALALGAIAPAASTALEIAPGTTFARSHTPLPQVFEGSVLPGWTQGAFSGSGYDKWVKTLSEVSEQNQAGGHPDSTMSFRLSGASKSPDGSTKDVFIDLPAGAVPNPQAVPACGLADFNLSLFGHCPTDSQIGVVAADTASTAFLSPLYRLTPAPVEPLLIGFKVLGYSVVMHPRVRTESDYGFSVEARDVPTSVALDGAALTLWGVPFDPVHDIHRFNTDAGVLGASVSGPVIPLTSAPTSCDTGPLHPGLRIRSWGSPENWLTETTTASEQTGCEALEFEPDARAAPTTDIADSPSGLAVDIRIPQQDECEPGQPVECGLATSHLKETTIELPDGIALNPSGANGLAGCSSSDIGLRTPPGSRPIHFSGEPADCPDAAKIGTAEVDTPLLGSALPGKVYIADPYDNPFLSLLAAYIAIEDPDRGIFAKLAAKVVPDPDNGQLTATLEEGPSLPIERVAIKLKQGPHAPLRTPESCGSYSSATQLTPYAAPSSPVAVRDAWSIVRAPAGGCKRPAAPEFEAGAVRPIAGVSSPFAARVRRGDGEQQLRSLTMELPPGLVAYLKGIPLCSATSLPSLEPPGRGGDPCPAASRVGSDVISAGAGVDPYFLPEGPIYLAGPYRGAPYSLVIVVRASAGPFDLGRVVTRAAIYIDPQTAQARIEVDPLPEIVRGIPIPYRSMNLSLDRPGLIRNPTSCEPARITMKATTAGEDTAQLSSRFQVADCAVLDFRPRLAVRIFGGLGRNGHPGLRAILRTSAKEAGLRGLSLKLPPGELLDLRHLRALCARQVPPEACPADSRLGYARLFSPLLDGPLQGPMYLRQHGDRLPDLIADLRHGQIHILLQGRTGAPTGRMRIRFSALPDVPLTKAVFTFAGGRRGIFVNSETLCSGLPHADATLRAHSGKRVRLRPEPRLDGAC